MKTLTSMIAMIVLFVMPGHKSHTSPTHLQSKTTSTTSTTLVDTLTISKWDKVAWCETHGDWTADGATFSGGLGISRVVWNEYGGQRFAPHAGLATKEEQIYIATQINGAYVPDQNGCNGGW